MKPKATLAVLMTLASLGGGLPERRGPFCGCDNPDPTRSKKNCRRCNRPLRREG